MSEFRFTCPYGCGKQFNSKHVCCAGRILSADQMIDISEGFRGGLPISVPIPSIDRTDKARCFHCHYYFKNHRKCFGGVLRVEDQIVNGQRSAVRN